MLDASITAIHPAGFTIQIHMHTPKPCHDFLYISGAFRRLYPRWSRRWPLLVDGTSERWRRQTMEEAQCLIQVLVYL